MPLNLGAVGDAAVRQVGADQATVGAQRGRKLPQHLGHHVRSVRGQHRGVAFRQPYLVRDRTREAPDRDRGVLERLQAVAQRDRRTGGSQRGRPQPEAVLGLAERVIRVLDLAGKRAGPPQPGVGLVRSRAAGQARCDLLQQVRHLPAEVPDRVLGMLRPLRRQQNAAEQPGGGPDQRVNDPAGRCGPGVDGQDQHRADRHLEHVVTELQHGAEKQPGSDRQAQAPPGQPHGSRRTPARRAHRPQR